MNSFLSLFGSDDRAETTSSILPFGLFHSYWIFLTGVLDFVFVASRNHTRKNCPYHHFNPHSVLHLLWIKVSKSLQNQWIIIFYVSVELIFPKRVTLKLSMFGSSSQLSWVFVVYLNTPWLFSKFVNHYFYKSFF